MRYRVSLLVLLASSINGSCDRTGGGAPGASSTASAPRMSLGNVMVQVARRFEIAGRAANANRFELSEFEAGEIEELFETDVPAAELPKEGPTAHIPAMAKAFLEAGVPPLKSAAGMARFSASQLSSTRPTMSGLAWVGKLELSASTVVTRRSWAALKACGPPQDWPRVATLAASILL